MHLTQIPYRIREFVPAGTSVPTAETWGWLQAVVRAAYLGENSTTPKRNTAESAMNVAYATVSCRPAQSYEKIKARDQGHLTAIGDDRYVRTAGTYNICAFPTSFAQWVATPHPLMVGEFTAPHSTGPSTHCVMFSTSEIRNKNAGYGDMFIAYSDGEFLVNGVRSLELFAFSNTKLKAERHVADGNEGALTLFQFATEFLAKNAAIEITGPILAPFIRALDDLTEIGQFELLDRLMEETEVDSLQPVFIVSILASTYLIQDRLVNRREFFREAEASLTGRGFDAEDYLRGLNS